MAELARTPKQIGNAIRRQRKKLGLSQAELGEKVGLRQATLSQIEAGNSSPRLDTLLGITAALDLDLRITARSKGWHKRDIEDLLE